MKPFAWVSLVWALLLGMPAAATSPNILIIIADDLGRADLGFQGSEIQTPHLDALVQQGVFLERFYAQPICGPTRISLMTGRVPQRMGLSGNIEPGEPGIPLDQHLMPETFQQAGYQTWLLGKWHLGDSEPAYLPNQRGFEHFFGFLGGGSPYYLEQNTRRRNTRRTWWRNAEAVTFPAYTTQAIADEAVQLLQARDPRRPVFLVLSFNAVHTPLTAPDELVQRYADEPNEDRRVYMAMADAMDQAVGRVLNELDAQGMRDDTLVLFFADNGGSVRGDLQGIASNGPLRGGKGMVYEGGINTVAAIAWPGQLQPGTSSAQVVTVYDVFPTLAQAAGLLPRATVQLDGMSLWEPLVAQRVVDRPGFVLGSRALAVIDGPWKLVAGPRNAEPELYRLETDPYETTDLAGQYPEKVAELMEWVETYRPERRRRRFESLD